MSGHDFQSDSGGERSRFERSATVAILAAALGLMLAAVMQAEPLQSANDRSRWCTVWSLVNRGTYRIDAIVDVQGWGTIDKVRHEGHMYSSKPPFLATIIAGIVVAVEAVTSWTLNANLTATTRSVLVVFNVLPMLAALVLWMRLLGEYASSTFTRIFLLTTAALGTLITPFLWTLSNHAPAAIGMFVSLYAILKIDSAYRRQEQAHGVWFAIVGFSAAWTCCLELPAAIWGLLTFFWLAKIDLKKTGTWYIPAAIVPLAFFFATNIICTGGIKPFYASYGTEKYVFETDGIPSYWADPKGLDKNADSFPVYVMHCLVGHHGIFSLSPVYLLMIPGMLFALRKQGAAHDALRPVVLAGTVISAVVLAFYLTRFDNYNYGGNSVALRWLLWLIPLWLIMLIPVLDRIGDRIVLQLLAALLLAMSTYSAWSPWPNPWQHPWLFTVMEDAGWLDQYKDDNPPFDRPLTTWIRSLPAVADGEAPVWVEMTSITPQGTLLTRKLTGRGVEFIDGERMYRLEIDDSSLSGALREQTYFVDVTAFDRGKPPAKFLRWPAGVDRPQSKQAVMSYWQGLPRSRPFRPGVVRYLKLADPINGVRTQRAASQIDLRYSEDKARRFRCDLWLADDLPFGVAQIEYTVSDPIHGGVLHKERWMVTAMSRMPAP